MSGLEQFKPQLKSGRISPAGKSIIYEIDSPADQIILPIETFDFLTQCNGQLDLTEIIENIYRKKNTIQFKLIYQTLLTLKEKGFLENGHLLDQNESFHFEKESYKFLSFSPIWNFYLGRRIVNDSNHPILFYFLSLMMCVGAILSLQSFSLSWLQFNFFKIDESYAFGVAFIFICSSLLISAKNIIKAILLLFLTGRAYNLSITFNGFALYLKTSSDSLFLVHNRFFLTLFHTANFLSYFAILYGLSFFSAPYLENAYGLALVLLAFDSNPYQPSEISSLLRSLIKNDMLNRMSNYLEHKSILALISPYQGRQNKPVLRIFTWYTLAWSTFTLSLLSHALGTHALSILSALRASEETREITEWVSGLMGLSVLVSFVLIVAYNFYKLLNLHFNPWTQINRHISVFNQKDIQITNKDKNLIIQVLQEFSLFSHFSSELFDQIVNSSQLKEVKKDSLILAPGEKCDQLQILLMGQASIDGKPINAPAIFGEVSFLETPIQTQKIIALKKSYILTIPTKLIFQLEAHDLHSREIESFKNSILVTQYFTNAPLFRDLEDDVSRLFINKGKIENFKKDHVLFKQGDLADGFYLLLKGSIEVIVNNRPITQIHEGGFFGEISMIADIPRTATIYATEDCKTLRITREAFWEILSKDINMAMFIESVGEMRVQEDVELLRTA
jgi:CRP/FNR family transcriptional regulator, cyclic AMP receptor protein